MFENSDQAIGYLAGIVDGEGTIRPSDLMSGRTIIVTNTDYGIIVAATRACDMLDIRYRVSKHRPVSPFGKQSFWRLMIGRRDDIERFRDLVPLHSVKAARLHGDTRARRPGTGRPAIPPRYGEAYELYERGMTIGQVGVMLGVSRGVARKWIVGAGCEIRTGSRRYGLTQDLP